MGKYKFFALYCVAVFIALAALTTAVGRIVFGIYNYGYYYRSNIDALFFVLMGIMAAAIVVGIFFAKKQCNENSEISSEIKMKPLILITGLLLAPALLIIVLMPVVIAI